MKPTHAELYDSCRADLISDAAHAEEQAANGPYFPGITKESLLAYAAVCRAKVAAMTPESRDEYVAKCVRHTLRFASPCPLPV